MFSIESIEPSEYNSIASATAPADKIFKSKASSKSSHFFVISSRLEADILPVFLNSFYTSFKFF